MNATASETVDRMVPAQRRTPRRAARPRPPTSGREAPLAALGFVGAGIAHDMRNLLTVIASNLDLLEAISALDAAARERVAGIRELALSGAGLTRRLLAVADPAARRVVPVDVAETVARTVRLLRHSLPRTVRIETGDVAADATIRAAEGELESALINLVRNAAEAMPGGGTIRVSVESVAGADGAASIAVSVADDGEGMPETVRRQVGAPFVTTKGAAGTGLGLAGVARFAAADRGWLAFNAGSVRGTRVSLTFPAA